ncbi:MAG TPA: type II toxin-antitoxin system VapC family toxin [Xanthobacteraceae bacterium]|nr:type II toxin-antitoxin system VapC family toxin [Xanthobacteraceae bacterium]
MRVLDASLLVEILLQTPLGIRHIDRVLDGNDSLHAPYLVDIETLNAIRRLTLADEISIDRAEAALLGLRDLDLTRHEHMPFIGRIWELRAGMTAYDAAYVALAEILPAVLFTCDGKLARASGHRAQVELLI